MLSNRLLFLFYLVFTSPQLLATDRFTSAFGQEFVRIPAGSFVMGTRDFDQLALEVRPERLEHLQKEAPAHEVAITQDLYLATTEVTQAMWFDIMGYKPGKERRWSRDDWQQLPVSRITWESVQEFIAILNNDDSSYRYRLPTEAEWEYAARAGTQGLRPFPYEDMDDYVWFRDNGDKPMPVGTKKPNAWGLYDMVGNLWEWVQDSYDAEYYSKSPRVDPPGPPESRRKVMRGGSYHCTPERVRVAIRGSWVRDRSLSILGFRLAADPIDAASTAD